MYLFFQLLEKRPLGLKRYEMEGQHVILYFDEIDEVTFSFKIYQSTVVKNTKPAAVTVYDYYETGEFSWRERAGNSFRTQQLPSVFLFSLQNLHPFLRER